MKRSTGLLIGVGATAALVALTAIPDWTGASPGIQTGPDGTAMVRFVSPTPWRVMTAPRIADAPAAAGGPLATANYKNVTVLTDVSAAEFDRLQTAMTAWVSPKEGCGFCHVGTDFSADHPMKTATRNMLQLTRALNTTWKAHVGDAGVTCFSCHRGEPVPPETWLPSHPLPGRPAIAKAENWNENADTVRKFFPDNGWALFFLGDEPVRATSDTALRGDTLASSVEVKRVYEMMMQMSDGIGANCTTCHNSRAFGDWAQSTPMRWVAYDAFRMMRDINVNYLLTLAHEMPQTHEPTKVNALVATVHQTVPQTGGGLANCATCHYGVLKPDPGTATLANFPELGTPNPPAAAARPSASPTR